MDARSSGMESKIVKIDSDLSGMKERLAKMPEGPAKAALKQQAMRLLQQRKLYQNQLGTIQSQSMNLEQTAFATQNAQFTATMVGAMQTTARELQQANRMAGSIDAVMDMREGLEDAMADSAEINELMSRSFDIGSAYDEADMETELAGLMDSELGGGALGVGTEAASDYLDYASPLTTAAASTTERKAYAQQRQ